jgi:hypothetical protein
MGAFNIDILWGRKLCADFTTGGAMSLEVLAPLRVKSSIQTLGNPAIHTDHSGLS